MSSPARARQTQRSGTRPAPKITGGFTNFAQGILIGLARDLPPTEMIVYGAICSQAHLRGRKYTEPTIEFLMECTNVGEAFVRQSLARIVEYGLLKAKLGNPHIVEGKLVRRLEYCDAFPIQKRAKRGEEPLFGSCAFCGADTEMERHAGWCSVPHNYWTKLPACVANSTHRVVGVIMAHTMGWQRWSAVLTHPEIMRDSGLSRRAVIEAIREATEKGLIGHDTVAHGTEYWVNIERFGALERLPPRLIEQRSGPKRKVSASVGSGGEETSKDSGVIPIDEPIKTPKRGAVEYIANPLTRCRNCGHVGPHKLKARPVEVSKTTSAGFESHFSRRTDGGTSARGAPGPAESPARRQETQTVPEIAAELRPLDAFLRSLGLRQNPSPAFVAAMYADLQGAPFDVFCAECRAAIRRILGAEISQGGVIRAIARRVGQTWAEGAPVRQAAQERANAAKARYEAGERDDAARQLSDPRTPQADRELIYQVWPELKR